MLSYAGIAPFAFVALLATEIASDAQVLGGRAKSALPNDVTQLIVAVADDWDSTRAKLQCFERDRRGGAWRPVMLR